MGFLRHFGIPVLHWKMLATCEQSTKLKYGIWMGRFTPERYVYLTHFLQTRVHCCLVAKSCPTLCNPIDGSTPGSSVLRCLPEFAQIHVHWVRDAIQPSHPLLPPSVFPSIRVFSSESNYRNTIYSELYHRMLKLPWWFYLENIKCDSVAVVSPEQMSSLSCHFVIHSSRKIL